MKTLSIMSRNVPFSLMTLSIVTLRIMTFRIETLNVTTFSKTIKKCDTKHNVNQHITIEDSTLSFRHNDTQHNIIHHYDFHYNETKHSIKQYCTKHNNTFLMLDVTFKYDMISVIRLNVLAPMVGIIYPKTQDYRCGFIDSGFRQSWLNFVIRQTHIIFENGLRGWSSSN